MSVNGGLVGPKARPKGVADGQQVNIPALSKNHYHRWGDGEGRIEPIKDLGSEREPVCVGKSAQALR